LHNLHVQPMVIFFFASPPLTTYTRVSFIIARPFIFRSFLNILRSVRNINYWTKLCTFTYYCILSTLFGFLIFHRRIQIYTYKIDRSY
jgi:hypothetical protein